MRCTSPRTVGFLPDGKTICWSPKKYSKEYATFQLPCGKCISCRLEYARTWAIRCVHESMMYDNNAFITLTYSDEHVGNNKLDYRDFQLFAMRLRSHIRADIRKRVGKQKWSTFSKETKKEIYNEFKISYFCTGEYGSKTKRQHWHAIIFNWRPLDAKLIRTTDRGDKVYSSDDLTKLWGKGIAEFGDVTFHSAGYCARYAAKKLSHGNDGCHDFLPISRQSTTHAIGKKWLEKFWPDIFNYGECRIQTSKGIQTCPIPRYYEKWLLKNHPEKWKHYVTQTKQNKITEASEKHREQVVHEQRANHARRERNPLLGNQTTRLVSREALVLSRFKQLQKNQKL